jgi:hypothetical protein
MGVQAVRGAYLVSGSHVARFLLNDRYCEEDSCLDMQVIEQHTYRAASVDHIGHCLCTNSLPADVFFSRR